MKNSGNIFLKVFTVLIITTFILSCNDSTTHNSGEIIEEDEAVIDEHVHEDEVPEEHKHDEDMEYNHEHEDHSGQHPMEDTASM